MKPNRYVQIDGCDLFVFDDILQPTAVSSIVDDLRNEPFNSRSSSSFDKCQYREWASQFTIVEFKEHPVHLAALEALTSLYPGVTFEFWDAHCNNTAFGDWAFMHRDSNETGAYSALYYANKDWDRDWFGETVFCKHGEPVVSVSVHPGRIVLFDSRIQHRAGVPAMNCPAQRMTLSLRYQADHFGSRRPGLKAEIV